MKKKPEKKEVKTTGHVWDGIEEFDNPMPRWWLYVLYATIVWGVLYTIAYPAWPMLSRATPGLLGYSTRGEVAADIQKFANANASIEAELAVADLTAIEPGSPLSNYAVNAGAAVFRNGCSQCHGAGAAGAEGYPNLLDNDWLWGGDIESIAYTVNNGIRNETDDARYSEMPKFGVDELLEEEEIDQVVQYVRQISGQEFEADMAAEGALVFGDSCAACHGDNGRGDREQGAPDLTDAIWLYGGDTAALTETVEKARFGVMPAWGQRLTRAEVNAVALYVYGLGGGE
jgi:cytochrome c oxidase cbb3-type subunit III